MRESNAPLGFSDFPMALIDFCPDDSGHSHTGNWEIGHEAIEMIKEGVGFERESATGNFFVPLESADDCVEYVTFILFKVNCIEPYI